MAYRVFFTIVLSIFKHAQLFIKFVRPNNTQFGTFSYNVFISNWKPGSIRLWGQTLIIKCTFLEVTWTATGNRFWKGRVRSWPPNPSIRESCEKEEVLKKLCSVASKQRNMTSEKPFEDQKTLMRSTQAEKKRGTLLDCLKKMFSRFFFALLAELEFD